MYALNVTDFNTLNDIPIDILSYPVKYIYLGQKYKYIHTYISHKQGIIYVNLNFSASS
jgi:hypothetical protein